MPPVSRKRSAPSSPPSEEASKSSSEDEQEDDPSSRTQLKYECSWEGCGKTYKWLKSLRNHYRSHTNSKPYKCTFPSFPPCNFACSTSAHIYKHIHSVHFKQSNRNEARKYIYVQKEVLAEEANLFGIKDTIREEFLDEEMAEEEDTSELPSLPQFTTIYRNSSGHYICPFIGCDHEANDLYALKVHYRKHCGKHYHPYRCSFPGPCGFAGRTIYTVERHIKGKHASQMPNADTDVSQFVDVRNDLFEMEDILFESATIFSAPVAPKPCLYECTFADCNKAFTTLYSLSYHRRIHTQSKPYRCSYPDCDHAATKKYCLLSHVNSAHFNIPHREHKHLSKEEKARAQQYLVVCQEELESERADIEMARTMPKRRKENQS